MVQTPKPYRAEAIQELLDKEKPVEKQRACHLLELDPWDFRPTQASSETREWGAGKINVEWGSANGSGCFHETNQDPMSPLFPHALSEIAKTDRIIALTARAALVNKLMVQAGSRNTLWTLCLQAV